MIITTKTAQKRSFSNPERTGDLVTFTEEIF